MSVQLPILAFNDVYRVSQRYVPQPGAPSDSTDGEAHISVSQFGELLLSERGKWADRKAGKGEAGNGEDVGETREVTDGEDASKDRGEEEGEKEGLVLFAGDVFSPSVESSVTRGSHMVSVILG